MGGSERASGTNPLMKSLNITLSVPEVIEIKMVDATALSDYEIWFFISSLLFGFFTAFVVPFIQSLQSSSSNIDWLLGGNTLAFFLLFAVSVFVALLKRRKLQRKSKSVELKVGN